MSTIKLKTMKTKTTLLALAILSITLTACNKEKRFSKKLIKGEKWAVKSINVEDSQINTGGTWLVTQDVVIYDQVPQVLWQNDTSNTIFNWQFQNKGDIFELNYSHDTTECDSNTLTYLDYLCYDITGTYKVEQHKKKEMRFSSEVTNGYYGQKVSISIEK
jgi:hypothetical protein